MSRTRSNSPRSSKKPEVSPLWEVPNWWKWTVMRQVGRSKLGKQKTSRLNAGAPTKYLRVANITDAGLDLRDVQEMNFTVAERELFALRRGDVVLSAASGSSAQVGRAALWSGEIEQCCYQNHVIRFRPHAVSSSFALLVFRHLLEIGHFASLARGVGIQNLAIRDFLDIPFPVPPSAEQHRISAEADLQLARAHSAAQSLESALRLNVEQDSTILEAAALGGLISSVAKGQRPKGWRSSVPSNANDRETSDGWNDFADLTDRWLPDTWRWVRVDYAGEVKLGRQRSPTHENGKHPFPYLRVANVFEDRIDTSDVRSMNFTPAEQQIYRLRPGDILLNEGQSPELVGRPAMYKGDPSAVCFQNTLIRFRSGDSVDPAFALLVFRHYLRAGYFTRSARWSTNIAHLGVNRFAAMPFPLPPLKEQQGIVEDARARLTASHEQRVVIRGSLDRLGEVQREVVRSAVSGRLVRHAPGDEAASALLERLGDPPPEDAPSKKRMKGMTRRRQEPQATPRPLFDVLQTLEGAVTPEALFEAAGYNRDSTADVESFYLALRAELGKRVRQVDTNSGIRLEVGSDAP